MSVRLVGWVSGMCCVCVSVVVHVFSNEPLSQQENAHFCRFNFTVNFKFVDCLRSFYFFSLYYLSFCAIFIYFILFLFSYSPDVTH